MSDDVWNALLQQRQQRRQFLFKGKQPRSFVLLASQATLPHQSNGLDERGMHGQHSLHAASTWERESECVCEKKILRFSDFKTIENGLLIELLVELNYWLN
jgi:hypothetical protein